MPPKKPPKNGTMIKATFKGWPWPLVACWCGADNTWVGAIQQCGMYEGVWNDWYFENERFEEDDLIKWEKF